MVESVRWRRLRWRLRGAWQWPAFAVLTLVDALLVARLPFFGEGTDAFGGVIFAGFVNLLAVALVAPFVGLALRRRRRDLPWFIARDYAGRRCWCSSPRRSSAAACSTAPRWRSSARRSTPCSSAVHNYVISQAPQFVEGLPGLDTRKLETDSYRACVYRSGERLPLCFFVNTDQSPAGIKRDPDAARTTASTRARDCSDL